MLVDPVGIGSVLRERLVDHVIQIFQLYLMPPLYGPAAVVVSRPMARHLPRPRHEIGRRCPTLGFGEDRHANLLQQFLGHIVITRQGKNEGVEDIAVLDELPDKLRLRRVDGQCPLLPMNHKRQEPPTASPPT